jgi:hypothetical protein
MEVDQQRFWHELLPILKAISNASFVTVDVEMSGISTRPRYSPSGRFNETGKPSLQEQYEETKEAAERYQVLQIGLTCVEQDRKNGQSTPDGHDETTVLLFCRLTGRRSLHSSPTQLLYQSTARRWR